MWEEQGENETDKEKGGERERERKRKGFWQCSKNLQANSEGPGNVFARMLLQWRHFIIVIAKIKVVSLRFISLSLSMDLISVNSHTTDRNLILNSRPQNPNGTINAF